MRTCLIIGGSGFIGSYLSVNNSFDKIYSTHHHNAILNNNSVTAINLDITNEKEVQKILFELSPDTIIHTAAISNFNLCAEHQKTAYEVNVIGTKNIALAAEKVKSRIIYISTDLVFDGNKSFYTEEDIPKPICYYGETKYEGEKIIASISSNYCISRTSLVYGYGINLNKSFSEIIISNLKNSAEVKLFMDEYRSPIYIKNLCDILLELAVRNDIQGLFHISGSQRLSRFEFGLKICELFGFDKKLIIPVSINDFSFKDERPKDCSMNNYKIKGVIKTNIQTIEVGLLNMLSD